MVLQVQQLHSKLDTNFGLKWDSQQDRSAEEFAELKKYIANFDQDNANLMEASMRTDQLLLALQQARVELPDELLDKHFTALVELKELRTLVGSILRALVLRMRFAEILTAA